MTALTVRAWAWPGAAAAPGPGDVGDLEAGDAARLESPRVANPSESSRRGAAVDGVRAALETMVPGRAELESSSRLQCARHRTVRTSLLGCASRT
jgi:hypothetical protein